MIPSTLRWRPGRGGGGGGCWCSLHSHTERFFALSRHVTNYLSSVVRLADEIMRGGVRAVGEGRGWMGGLAGG